MATEITRESITQWQQRNPLKLWRRETGTTLNEVAIRVGVSVTAIQKWEAGTSNPAPENMGKLRRLLDRDNLALDWDAWIGESPA